MGRPETDQPRQMAMSVLGNGLHDADHHEDALSVREAELSTLRRLGASEENILVRQTNLATTYNALGRLDESHRMLRDVYFGRLKLYGEEHASTILVANNYALSFLKLERFKEARSLTRQTMPVARRVLGENHEVTLRMRQAYAQLLCRDEGATLDDLREAVTTFEEIKPTARRVLGGDHPFTVALETSLRSARAALRANETGDMSSVCEALRKAEV